MKTIFSIMACLTSTLQAVGMSDEALKALLLDNFRALEGVEVSIFDAIRNAHSIDDEQFYRVLTNIWVGAGNRMALTERDSDEGRRTREIMSFVLSLLPTCENVPVKGFLHETVFSLNDGSLRLEALHGYLLLANAEEMRDILTRFLVGEDRMGIMDRLSIYSFAEETHDETDDLEKRAAILGALAVAADREEEKIAFMKADRILSLRNGVYRRSRERLAMLERHALEPPTSNLYTDQDLAAALKTSRKIRDHSHVETNFEAIVSGLAAWTRLENAVPDEWEKIRHAPPEQPKPVWPIIVTGGVVMVLAGVWMWRGWK